jgi:PLP dependent protein
MLAEEVRRNVVAIEARIEAACRRSGRARREVTLVAVSKTFPAQAVDFAVAAGVEHIGENRVQELRDKIAGVQSKPTWHLIGHLQTNKAKDAVRLFDVIETVDSTDLAAKLSRAAAAAGRTLRVLLQVNVADERQKSGATIAELPALAQAVSVLPSLELSGLMTIPPIASAPEESRQWFRRLRDLRNSLPGDLRAIATDLSMGMSEDFEVAIEEGATMIRVGRAIFGARSAAA